jgi:hypothetical protein
MLLEEALRLCVPASRRVCLYRNAGAPALVTYYTSLEASGLYATCPFFLKSSQADSGLGPGDVPGDIQGWTVDTPDTSGQLRAERYGTARTYTLTYRGKGGGVRPRPSFMSLFT